MAAWLETPEGEHWSRQSHHAVGRYLVALKEDDRYGGEVARQLWEVPWDDDMERDWVRTRAQSRTRVRLEIGPQPEWLRGQDRWA